MTIAYVAQTRDHMLMLDEEGVCLHVHRRRSDTSANGVDASAQGAIRCVGAQYVAALDPSEPGFLVQKPKLGVPMIFAKADPTGKIALVRTGALERFDTRAVSGVYERPSTRDLLADTQQNLSPAIRYLPIDDDEEEPTLKFRPPTTMRSGAA